MKYYLHDSTAFSDEKVTLLYLKFGFEAVGLFYVILEKLALQEQPINETVLKSQLNIKKRLEKQLSFMYEIGILSINNGDVFNENILKFSEKYQIKKEKTKERVSQWRKNQEDKKNVTRYKHVRNNDKDNISKDNISKEEKEKPFNFRKSLLDLGIEKQIVEDWLKVRKTKKATNTQTAFDLIKSQIELTGVSANECIKKAVEKSWAGFKAEWINKDEFKVNGNNPKISLSNDAMYGLELSLQKKVKNGELTEQEAFKIQLNDN